MEDVGVSVRIILKCVLKISVGRAWIGMIWIRSGTGGRLLLTLYGSFNCFMTMHLRFAVRMKPTAAYENIRIYSYIFVCSCMVLLS